MRSRKCLNKSEAMAAIFVFRLAHKFNTNLVKGVDSLLPKGVVRFYLWVAEKSKIYQPIRRQGGHLCFPISPKNTILVEDIICLLDKVSSNSVHRLCTKMKYKMWIVNDGRIIVHLIHLCFPIGPKITNLVEDVEYLLPDKFRRILFRGCKK